MSNKHQNRRWFWALSFADLKSKSISIHPALKINSIGIIPFGTLGTTTTVACPLYLNKDSYSTKLYGLPTFTTPLFGLRHYTGQWHCFLANAPNSLSFSMTTFSLQEILASIPRKSSMKVNHTLHLQVRVCSRNRDHRGQVLARVFAVVDRLYLCWTVLGDAYQHTCISSRKLTTFRIIYRYKSTF